MYRFFQQSGGMRFKGATTGRSLTRKLGLNLGSDIDGDGHGAASLSLLLSDTLPRAVYFRSAQFYCNITS
jgi:hypothetical protein